VPQEDYRLIRLRGRDNNRMKNRPFSLFAATCVVTLCGVRVTPAMSAQQSADTPKPAQSPTPDHLTLDQVSAEPDSDQRMDTLRWSPDGARAAWLQLVLPSPRSSEQAPQYSIWSFASDSEPQSAKPSDAPTAQPSLWKQHGHPALLVPAAKVTAALRGTEKPAPHMGDDSKNTAYLLREFAWSSDHASLLLIGTQSLAWFDITSSTSRLLVSGNEALSDATLSPDGKTISFIRNHDLWLLPVSGGTPRKLFESSDASQHDLLRAELDWLYRNEIHLQRAYWWSPDSQRIAYLQIDDRGVNKYGLRASDGTTREIVYPKPGGEIPIVRVFIQSVAGGRPQEIDLGPTKNTYLPRIAWAPDARHLAIERLARLQKNLDLFFADTTTGKSRLLLTEKDMYWINLSDDLYFFKDGKRFLWSCERNSFRHLYLYDIDGKQLARLTHGDWEVSHLDAVDESNSRVYFTATEKSPLERHLYQVSIDGGAIKRITQQAGTHQVSFAPGIASFVDSYSTAITPPQMALISQSDSTLAATASAPAKDSDAKSLPPLQPVDFITITLHMGTEAHAFLIRPPNFDAGKKYPVILYLAGGPGEQLVRDAWGGSASLWMQFMAQKGYIVFAVDNQGTTGRGHYFEEPIHLRLAAQEMVDQRDGFTYLTTLLYVDTTRVGVCGWGYGGFLAIHAMFDRPVPYRAGFAGAPIIDWRSYDAFFAERYLDDPVTFAHGWRSSIAGQPESLRFLKGQLAIAQGTLDEFVHMENLLTLQSGLLDVGKSADVLLLSDRGHHIEDRPARLVLFTHMTDFFVRNL